MKIKLMTYNLLLHNASKEINYLVSTYSPDIICFQEVLLEKKDELLKFIPSYYHLAGYSNSFIKFGNIYGVATLYNKNKFKLVDSTNNRIPHTLYDWFRFFRNIFKLSIKREYFQSTFLIPFSKKKFSVFNIHLTAEASNEARINQLKNILKHTNKIKNPIIIAGDFNYIPYRRKKLEVLLNSYKFKEATNKINFTFFAKKNLFFYGFFLKLLTKIISQFITLRYKLDYIFYRQLRLIECQRLDSKISDHYPISAIFEI